VVAIPGARGYEDDFILVDFDPGDLAAGGLNRTIGAREVALVV